MAFAWDDVLARVRDLRRRGVALMAVPDNYYVDLAARFPMQEDRVAEVLERRGGYDAYGSANTHVRLAAPSRAADAPVGAGV